MNSIGVILSAGIGSRFQNKLPKQYHLINDKMVIEYVVDALKASNLDDVIIMCGDKEFCDMISNKFHAKTLLGGKSRNETVLNALNFIRKHYSNVDNVLFFDSARPNIKPNYINECLEKLKEFDCVITTQKITDSIGCVSGDVLNRENFFFFFSPECFKLSTLENFDKNDNSTAIFQQLDKKFKIYKNFNCANNIKITYPLDIEIAKAILKEIK